VFPYPRTTIIPIRSCRASADCRFVTVTPLYAPTSDGKADNIFITKSYDATSHFETVVGDVFDVWQRVTGEKLVLKKREVEVEA
jgi:Rab GDP dissociation inhibitor